MVARDISELSSFSKKMGFFTAHFVIVLCGQEIKQQLPTLHCTVIGLTRERFVVLGLPS